MKIGFVGAGNMACAIIGGILDRGVVDSEEVRATDVLPEARRHAAERFEIEVGGDNAALASWADVLVLAVKPQFLESAVREVRDHLSEGELVISIAAGKSLMWLEDAFGRPVPLIRVMPNTPALIGDGVSGLCANRYTDARQRAIADRIFESVGTGYWLSEEMVDVVGVVAGCTPAFAAIFIEALSDAAVAEGMPRTQATDIAARAVAGSAELVVQTGKHPAVLKDMVTSPGGTTIEGVQVLEEGGLRSTVMHAVRAAVSKTRQL